MNRIYAKVFVFDQQYLFQSHMSLNSPIEQLTTAVFGFALAVGALSLTKVNPETTVEVVAGLVFFSLSFIILVVIWWGISEIMVQIDNRKPVTVFLNIVLLFFVAIEPYLLNLLSTSTQLFPLSSTLYGIDMAILMSVSAALSHILVKENKTTFSSKQLIHFKQKRNNQVVSASLFFFSVLPQFLEWTLVGMSVRVLIWFATLAISLTLLIRNRNK